MRFLFFLIFLINTAMANYIDLQEEPKRVKIMAVGDNLIHMPVIRSGKKKGGFMIIFISMSLCWKLSINLILGLSIKKPS